MAESKKYAVLFSLLLLVSGAAAFSGESAAVNGLLDLLLKKEADALGKELVNGLMDLCRNEFMPMLLRNPDVMDPALFTITQYFIAVLGPLFVSIILVSGIYIIFFSGSPETRTRIKKILPLAVAAMILVIISPHIMNIILYVSESATSGIVGVLTNSILPADEKNPMVLLLPYDEKTNPVGYLMDKFDRITWYSSEASMPFLLFSAFILLALLLVVIARYLIVSAFVIIFPLTIFLYLIEYTRSIGRRLMEQTLLWIFLQAIEAVVLLGIASLVYVSAGALGEEAIALFRLAGIIVLICAPALTIIFFRDFLPT